MESIEKDFLIAQQQIEKDFLIAQHQYLAKEIRFSKRQQMMATWYILLLFGAIVKTHEYWFVFHKPRLLPIFFSIFLLCIGWIFICTCKNSQKNNNGRSKEVLEKIALPIGMTKKEYAIPCFSITVNFLYYIIHFFACVVTIFIIIN